MDRIVTIGEFVFQMCFLVFIVVLAVICMFTNWLIGWPKWVDEYE